MSWWLLVCHCVCVAFYWCVSVCVGFYWLVLCLCVFELIGV